MDNQIFDKIAAFIIRERGKYKKGLNRDTLLEKGLLITGDDADEILEKFGKEFNVDMSELDLSIYFANENSLAMYLLVIFGKDTGKRGITLGDLEQAIETGKLK